MNNFADSMGAMWLYRYQSWTMSMHHTVPIKCLPSLYWTWKSNMLRLKTSLNAASSLHSVVTWICGTFLVTG